MNEHLFDPATHASQTAERPFLPRINDGGILGRLGEANELHLGRILQRLHASTQKSPYLLPLCFRQLASLRWGRHMQVHDK